MIKDIVARLIRLEKVVHSMRLNVSGGLSIKKSPYGTMLIGPGKSSGGGEVVTVKWARATEALSNNSKLTVVLRNNANDADVGSEFDVWVFWDRRTSFTASEYRKPDGVAIATNDKVLVCQDQHGAWYLCPGQIVKCESLTVMTNFQVDGGNSKLQKKTATIYCFDNGTESGWTDIHTGTECAE